MSLAMDQIFCLAPSMRPPIEPVVSITKQTSRRGLTALAMALAGWLESASFGAARAQTPEGTKTAQLATAANERKRPLMTEREPSPARSTLKPEGHVQEL